MNFNLVKNKEQDFLLSELVKKSSNEKLRKAKDHQRALKALYSGDKDNMAMWYFRWKSLLAEEKYSVFEKMYESYFAPILDKIQTQYEKIFSATGRTEIIDFGDNVELKALFQEAVKPNLFESGSALDFFKKNYIRLLLSEPSSLFLTYRNENGEVKTKYLDFLNVRYVDNYDNGNVKNLVYEYDKQKNILLIVTRKEIILYNERIKDKADPVIEREFHGQLQPPVTYVSSDFLSSNATLRKSPLTDSMVDIENYNIFKTFSVYYKSYSAFGKEYVPETLDGLNDGPPVHSFNNLNGDAIRPIAINEGKNTGVFGNIIEIPLSQMADKEQLENLHKMYFKQEGDTKLLVFQQEDLDRLESKILSDCLGHNFSKSGSGAAKTASQVYAEMDTQESNLRRVKAKAETALNSINTYGCIYTELSENSNFKDLEAILNSENLSYEVFFEENTNFVTYKINLGDRFFLKSEEMLYEELTMLMKNSSNEFLIEKKLEEIVRAKAGFQENELSRFKITYMLQPFSNRNLDWVTQNRVNLDPYDLFVYDNFKMLLFLFQEKYNGDIATLGKEKENSMNFVYQEFNKFAKEQYDLMLLRNTSNTKNSNQNENQ